jgi:hypothetical protein
MKKGKIKKYLIYVKSGNKLNGWQKEEFIIDIFGESINEYLKKLNAVAEGRYELDDYDRQVLNIVMEQYAATDKSSQI